MADQATENSRGEDPDIGSCLNLLEKLEGEDRESFVHKVINDLCEKVGIKYDEYFKLLSVADYSNLKNTLSSTVRQLSREALKKEELAEKLQGMGASSDVSQLVATCLWVRRDEIHDQLVKDSCNISLSRLDDFDWKLKLIMSSSQLSSIQQPVVSLDFDLTENGEKRRQDIELSKDELSQLVASLEAANKVVTQLRT